MTTGEIMESAWPIIPDWAKDDWRELPRDVDCMVAHDWIRDMLKNGLIKMHMGFTKQIKENEWESVAEVSGILDLQSHIESCLGKIELYLFEHSI